MQDLRMELLELCSSLQEQAEYLEATEHKWFIQNAQGIRIALEKVRDVLGKSNSDN